jgi:hypothetical protein
MTESEKIIFVIQHKELDHKFFFFKRKDAETKIIEVCHKLKTKFQDWSIIKLEENVKFDAEFIDY